MSIILYIISTKIYKCKKILLNIKYSLYDFYSNNGTLPLFQLDFMPFISVPTALPFRNFRTHRNTKQALFAYISILSYPAAAP